MTRVLIIEDEANLAAGIRYNLELDGYEVDVIGDGLAALALLTPGAEGPSFDLLVLDVMLPGMDGFTLADRLRRLGNLTPILMLTAKGLPEDVVHGLEAGADDYLPKPFDLPVFLARVRGLLRRRDWARGAAGEPHSTRIGEAEVDFQNFELKVRGESFRLTLLEAMLLKLLVENAGRVVSKGEILEKVWNLSADTQTRAVDNFVMRLRRYLEEDPRTPRYLHTVRGAGYQLRLEP